MQAIVSNVVRRVLKLPLRTPTAFMLHQRGMQMPQLKDLVTLQAVVEITRAANSRHRKVRASTQTLILHAFQEHPPLLLRGSDYD